MGLEDPVKFSRRPSYRRVGLYLFWLVVSGICTAVLVFSITMQALGWRLAPLEEGPRGSFSGRRQALAIYVSPTTQAYFTSIGARYETLLASWSRYGQERGIPVNLLSTLDGLDGRTQRVLVLPSAVALSSREREAIQRFYAEGGNLLITWASGTRLEGGSWTGWDFLQRLGDVRFKGEIPRDAAFRGLLTTGLSPVSMQLDAGQPVGLGQAAEPLLRLQALNLGARYISATGATPDGQFRQEGAIAYREGFEGAGRVVTFGFAESAWDYHPFYVHRLVDDALDWLSRTPSLTVANWPRGLVAAQAMTVSTDVAAQALALPASARPSVYAAPALLRGPDANPAFSRMALGVLGDPTPADSAAARQGTSTLPPSFLGASGQLLAALARDGLRHYLSPGVTATAITNQRLYDMGYRSHLADRGVTTSALPIYANVLNPVPNDRFVQLARFGRSDTELLASNPAPDALAQSMIDDVDLNALIGGLGVLSLHAANLNPDQAVALAAQKAADHARSRNSVVWVANTADITDWWRKREALRLAVRYRGQRVEFDLTIVGQDNLPGAALMILLPGRDVLPSISGLKAGMPIPQVRQIDAFRAALVWDALPAGNYSFQATFQ
ncbi:MAG TPA: hypothetical protein PKD73_17235 [Burkholderiaceae bacterium]|nr:hypothetical protein [Burkholderiaceae bacterium]